MQNLLIETNVTGKKTGNYSTEKFDSVVNP